MAGDRARGERRAYARGEARRTEILAAALKAFAEQGYRGSSLRDIAAGTGVSAAGILHHFGSKEGLLSAVLAERERVNQDLFPVDERPANATDHFRDVVAHNSTQPGLVRLYATLALEAADPEHPAHAWFVERYARAREDVRAVLAEDLAPLREAEREATIQLFIAVSDGLQMQWLLDRKCDMRAGMDRFVDLHLRAGQDQVLPGTGRPASASSSGAPRVRQRRLGPAGASAVDRIESFGHHGRLADGHVPASLEAEVEAACSQLGAALAARGSGWADVVEVRTLHAELTDPVLEVAGKVLRARVAGRDVSWLAQAAPELGHDGLRVEVSAIALTPTTC